MTRDDRVRLPVYPPNLSLTDGWRDELDLRTCQSWRPQLYHIERVAHIIPWAVRSVAQVVCLLFVAVALACSKWLESRFTMAT